MKAHWAMGCGENAQPCCSLTSQPTASLPPGRSGWGAQVAEWVWGQPVFLSYTADCVLRGDPVLGKVDGRAGRRFLPNHGACALQELERPGPSGGAQKLER